MSKLAETIPWMSGENDPVIGDRDAFYLSFDEVPLDEPEDGDNSLLADAPWANPDAPRLSEIAEKDLRRKLEKATAVAFAPNTGRTLAVVPHPRDLFRRSPKPIIGRDVVALQRALAKGGYRKWDVKSFTGQFGKGTEANVKALQRKKHLTPDGVYGPSTHKALAPFYDTRGIWLLNHTHVVTPLDARRQKLVTAAMIAYNDRWDWHYSQGPSRMWLVRHRVKDPRTLYQHMSVYEDCSSGATWLTYVADVPDPNGFGYRGWGFTGTLASHGQRVHTDGAPIGAMHFYGGSPPYHHVTVRVTKSGRCFSHGSEAGPYIVDTYYRGDLRQSRIHSGLA